MVQGMQFREQAVVQQPLAGVQRRLPIAALCCGCVISNAWAAELFPLTSDMFQWSGYIKTLYVQSETPYPQNEPYSLSLNRLRLKLDAWEGQNVSVHIEHDTVGNLGSYVNTQEFAGLQQLRKDQYEFGSGVELASGSNYYLFSQFYRAYVRLNWGDFDVIAGRQRIPLGTGRFWSGLDVLNPDNPSRVEREERIGVDALKVEYRLGNLTRVTYLYAPDPLNISGPRQLVQFTSNWHDADFTVTGGLSRGDGLLGFDFATKLFDAGVRGEWIYVNADIGGNYQKALLGLDYAFVSGLTLSAEAYINTQSPADLAATLAQLPQLPFLQSIGRRYLGASADYEPNPIYKFTTIWLRNQEDQSDFFSAVFTYSIRQTTSLTVGAQAFSGAVTSEFGQQHPLFFASIQWYF